MTHTSVTTRHIALLKRDTALKHILLHCIALPCELPSITIVTLLSEPVETETSQELNEEEGLDLNWEGENKRWINGSMVLKVPCWKRTEQK